MSLGKTLKDVQRFSKKQSKKKNYLGWFQSFGGGESPINNAFFNMAMGSADGIAGVGEADGGIGMTASMGESLNEENETNIIDKVAEHFGTYNLVPEWKTFILPDGRFLNMDKLRAHSDVEQWLINNGLSNEKFAYIHMGSPTLSKLGCFRCNPRGRYCILPEVDYPTDEALNSLLLWLDSQSSNGDYVTIVTPSGKSVRYSFSDYISDDIVDRIDRFYTSGTLYEKHVDIKRAGNAKYERNPVGDKLSLCKINESIKAQKEMEFLQASKSDSWNRRRRTEIGERYKRGAVGEKLSVEEENKESWLSDQIKKFRSTKKGDFLYSAHRLSTTVDPKFLEQVYNQNPNLSVDELLTVAGLQKETKKETPPKNNRKEKDTEPEKGVAGKPIMEDFITFHVSDGLSHKNDKEISVSVEDVINTLVSLLEYDTDYIDMSDEELRSDIETNLDPYVDTYYEDLCEVFCKDNGCEEKKHNVGYEEDPFLLQYTFDGIDSDDPDIAVTEYDYRSPYDFDEDWDEEEQDDDDEQGMSRYKRLERKSVYDSDGFTTDYVLYYDYYEGRYFTMFGDEDLYAPNIDYADADFDTYEQAKEWFDNYEGFTDEDEEEEDFIFDECVHPTVKANAYKKPSNPYSKVKDVSFYDDDVDGHSRVTESGFKPKKSKFKYDDNPINEGAMSELDIERQENAELLDKLRKDIDDLNDELKFLRETAPKEIRRGGAFDSQAEIDDAIEATERELKRTTAKYKILLRSENK